MPGTRGSGTTDAAPLYGYGLGEECLGRMLRGRAADEFAISTKVGRLLVPLAQLEADPFLERDWQRLGAVTGIRPDFTGAAVTADWYFHGVPDVRPVFDFSHDGVMRSVEQSLARTGLDRLDLLWIHDPDDHWQQAIDGAYPALARLRVEALDVTPDLVIMAEAISGGYAPLGAVLLHERVTRAIAGAGRRSGTPSTMPPRAGEP